MKDKILGWINSALVADFFLVVFGFLWLGVAVLGRTIHVPLGLDIWHRLWQPLFGPAIGILMSGTIISGISSWIAKRLNSQQLN